jgi:DHA1 family tetracycline resistance protein-like MFS transporter
VEESTFMTETMPVSAASAVADDKLDFKKILPIFVIVLIDLMGLTIIIPLMPLYAAAYGATAIQIGLLGATYPIFQFFGAPLLGRLSDRYGRKPVLIVSQIGTLIGFLILGFAPSLLWLFISRAIDGLSGGNIATAQAVVTDSTNEKTRTQGLGLIGAAFGLGFIVGPVIAFASLAATQNNYHAPAFVAAGFSLISIFLTWFWLEESHPPEKRAEAMQKKSAFSFSAMAEALRHPTVGILLILIFAQQIAFGGFEQLLSLFTLVSLGLGASGNSIVFVYVGVIVVMVQGYFIGKWARKWGDRRLILIGLSTLAVGMALLAVTPQVPPPFYSKAEMQQELSGSRTLPGETPLTQGVAAELPSDANRGWIGLGWLLLAMMPVAIGGGLLQPSINSMLTKRTEADERGGILGISAAFLSAANALAPLIGALLFAAFFPSAPFWFWAALMGVLWIVAMRRIPSDRPAQTALPA